MTTPSKAGFDLRYPEFSTTESAMVEARLADALIEMNITAWDNNYERGAYALTAHMLTIDAMDSASALVSGAISSKTVGDVTVSYATSSASYSADYADYALSKYGREYMRLMRQVASGPWVIS